MREHYNIINTDTPHLNLSVHFEDGRSFEKSIPNDENNKISQEDHVIHLFAIWYGSRRYTIDAVQYEILGRDGKNGQRHDYTIKLKEVPIQHHIEITKFGDSSQGHLAHALRDLAYKLIDELGRSYFVFLPSSVSPKQLKGLFIDAQSHPKLKLRDHSPISDEVISLIKELKLSNKPFIRLVSKGNTQIHTYAVDRTSMRESLQKAVSKKEAIDYSPLRQQDMILVLDDKSMNFSREDIDARLELLNMYFFGSTFKEIYLLSRMSSPNTAPDARHEFMIFPIKATWDAQTRANLIYVMRKITNGITMPLGF